MTAIATLFYRKVKAGEMTIDEVPKKWREEVRKAIEEDAANH